MKTGVPPKMSVSLWMTDNKFVTWDQSQMRAVGKVDGNDLELSELVTDLNFGLVKSA